MSARPAKARDGVDFAVLSDRLWKSSPTLAVPEAQFRNGWIQNTDFDPRDADSPDAELLGPEQERFLASWAEERSAGAWTRETPSPRVVTSERKRLL